MQDAHPVIEAMVAVVIHLVHATAMLHEGLGNYFRGGGFEYGHSTELGTTGFMASQKMISSLK